MVTLGLENTVKKLEQTYVIGTAQYNTGANKQLLKSLETYQAVNDAKILVLPTVGQSSTEEERLAKEFNHYEVIKNTYNINKNLKIKDFGVRPQQINPLTGLERFAQGDKSYIMPGTKQVLKYIANSYDTIPKAIATTGALTHPNYRTQFRTGRIAKGDHEYGFVVVEQEDKHFFHFRQVKALKNGKFVDKGYLYNGEQEPVYVGAKALVVGDLHPYDTDPMALQATLEQIKYFKPENIFLHDAFCGRSISHYHVNNNLRQHQVFKEQGQNLEAELKETLKSLRTFAKATKGTVYVVASNHNEHLDRYLQEGRFINDKGNQYVGSKLFTGMLEGSNPLAYGLSMVGKVPKNVHFLERDEDFKLLGYQLAHHGDLGANGGRSSPRSIENANGKSITGHSHTGMKIRNTYKVGTITNLRLDYNRGYSNWTQTNAVLDCLGHVQLINTINNHW